MPDVATAATATKKGAQPRGWVSPTADGLVTRRTAGMDPKKAQRIARLWAANPAFQDAWTEKLPNSSRLCVRWIPASAAGQEQVEQAWMETMLAKAQKEGRHYQFLLVRSTGTVSVYNPKSGRSYRIRPTRDAAGAPGLACSCPVGTACGLCKHILAGVLQGVIDPPVAEPATEPVPAAAAAAAEPDVSNATVACHVSGTRAHVLSGSAPLPAAGTAERSAYDRQLWD